MPEIFLTGYGIAANICFVLALCMIINNLRSSHGRENIIIAIMPVVIGFALLAISEEHLLRKKITNTSVKPLIALENATSIDNMTIAPYNISVTKQQYRRKSGKTFKYSYNVDMFIQQSEALQLKKSPDKGFKVVNIGNKSDGDGVRCMGIRYGNREIEVVQRGNYYINCKPKID